MYEWQKFRKKYFFRKKNDNLNLMNNHIVYRILFFHHSTSLLEYRRDRQISSVMIILKLYIIFWKKHFVKNESFKIFWFQGSRN